MNGLAFLFWIITIVAVVFGFWAPTQPNYARYALWPVFLLIIILGLEVFGFFGLHLTGR